jgi:hypothetical protein
MDNYCRFSHSVNIVGMLPTNAAVYPFFGASTNVALRAISRLVLSRIAHLLAPCRPSAITRLVISFIVDAVQRVKFGWTHPHIGKEVWKRLVPTSTDSDSPNLVIKIARLTRITASAFHVEPSPVFGSQFTYSCKSVDGRSWFPHYYIIYRKVA